MSWSRVALPLRPVTVPGIVVLAGLVAASPAAAQSPSQQVVRGPVATYWLTADTVAGMAAMGAGGGGLSGLMGMMSGRGNAPQRTLDLRLGSSQAASGGPRAEHVIPAGMAMGRALPLVTPETVRDAPAEPASSQERPLPEGVEQPKGRMLIFWGCGETVGAGQPVIIDFSRIGPGQPMPALVSRTINLPRGPAFGANRSFGAWPNERDRQAIPPQASLRGEHLVQGNYSPDIRFNVDRHDFMPPVALTQGARTAGGAQPLAWGAVGGATGYFASAFGAGGGDGGNDIVMWTSSAVQETGGMLSGHVPPAEVARLVRERVVMPPDRTECTVPAAVMKAMPMGMLSFTAYGDELNLSHPPRPQDPKVPWDIQWTVKLRLKSSTSAMLGQGLGGAPGDAAAPTGTDRADAPAPAPAESSAGASAPPPPRGTPSPTDAVGQGVEQGVRMLRGILGR